MSCDVLIISSSDRPSENSGNIVTGVHLAIRGTVSHLSTDTMQLLPDCGVQWYYLLVRINAHERSSVPAIC